MKHLKYLLGAFIAMLILGACSNDANYVIESNPNEFAIYPVALPVNAEGGTYELKITGNERWNAELTESNSSAIDWCTLSETSGTGPKVITVTVTPSNSFVKNRTVVINVKSNSKSLRSKVIQETMTLGEDEVLINGLVWSLKNIDEPGTFVDSPDDIGMLYQFNRKVGYPATPADAPTNWPSGYTNDNTNWSEENDPSPEGWRIPTTAEMAALWEKGSTWVTPAQTGFKTAGIIVGVDEATAKNVTKDNLKQMGALFLPQSGWRNETGTMDRTWLVAVRSATALSDTHGGMSLGDSGGYRDLWGWGDGQKIRAAMIRPVKKITVEE